MAYATRSFRIFVSSTFSDLKQERNALQKFVFPRLRELCSRHGCRFQAIDLRWGVREEAGLDQQTMKICLDEVTRSQRVSPRPNFIVLLGDRYGWRPLPTEIPATEFAQIEQHTAGGRELLAQWYRRDDNAVPPVYCLQPRHGRFAEFDVWEREVERPLRSLLLDAITGLDLRDRDRLKYGTSATEQEIASGALLVPDAREHVFCFFRRITDLPENPEVRDWRDLDDSGVQDHEALHRLDDLKSRLRAQLPGNIHAYTARWSESSITTDHIGTLPAELDECLQLLRTEDAVTTLCVDVWRRLARAILTEIERLEGIEPLEKEIHVHRAFGADRARSFVGRAATLAVIAQYARGGGRHPLAITGASGSGKTALLGYAMQQAAAQSPDTRLIVRFVGATPASSDGRALLESICREASRYYGADEQGLPSDFQELVKELPKRLALATATEPLIVLLDALDQLSEADHARSLTWLPAELPEHVRLIVSAVAGDCSAALADRLPPAQLLQLEPMSADEGRQLLNLWLDHAGRTLQSEQRTEVLERFAASGMPLYLKLAFEEARRWTSYTERIPLGTDIPGLIRDLFVRLSSDTHHGSLLVKRSLSYLAAAKHGLSEDEMLDVLSRDEAVFADFAQRARHTPPESRLPVVVWSRLYFDLEPYLTERSADGAALMSFYHRQLREVVEADFLAGEDGRARHASLADYFASQELFDRERKTPNLRKLSELPFQQTLGEQWDQLHATLTDFDFLEAKCTHVAVTTTGKGETARSTYGGVYELQEDYRFALERIPPASE